MIIVFSKPNCMQCNFTKKFLDEHELEYQVVDVIENPHALKLIKDYGYTGVPVVALNTLDNSWYGFRPDLLEELYEE